MSVLKRLREHRLVWLVVLLGGCQTAPAPRLETWNDGDARHALVEFVDRVTDPASPDFVPEPERIAVFDNDGTLWAEQPVYFQLLFAMDRVRELAPQHPEWSSTQPYQAAIAGDLEQVAAGGEEALLKIVMASHSGMTTDEFAEIAREWLHTAQHPTHGRRFKEMVYAPMLEVLDYLRAHGFKTFIVSGGGVDFLRVFAEEVYGIPPEQVCGSRIEVKFENGDGGPRLVREPKIAFIDDKAGKPVGIHTHIGRRPIAAFGNSDGDHEMLLWTAAGEGPSLCVLVHHTDAEREWAYDRDSHIGKLDAALDDARAKGWTVIDVARDWKQVFPDL